MSNPGPAFDPLATMPEDAGETAFREYASALVRNGIPADPVNRGLQDRGFALLKTDSAEALEYQRDKLLNNREFRARLLDGDSAAMAEVTALELQKRGASGKLTQKPSAPGDFSFPTVAAHFPTATQEQTAELHTVYASVAADLKMKQDVAKSIVQLSLDGAKRAMNATDGETETYRQKQTALIKGALGADADARLAKGSEILTRATGKKFDLAGVAAMSGAEMAITLLWQAEALARKHK